MFQVFNCCLFKIGNYYNGGFENMFSNENIENVLPKFFKKMSIEFQFKFVLIYSIYKYDLKVPIEQLLFWFYS